MTDDALRDAIRRMRIELRILNDAIAGAAGLRPNDLDILDVIDREGPCTPSHLAERTAYRRATLTDMLARLERDGWVARTVDPHDGRSSRLASTPRIRELRRLYARADAAATAATAALSDTDRGMLTSTLHGLADGLRAAAPASDQTPAVVPKEVNASRSIVNVSSSVDT